MLVNGRWSLLQGVLPAALSWRRGVGVGEKKWGQQVS